MSKAARDREKAIKAAKAMGYRIGQEEMRERCARVVDPRHSPVPPGWWAAARWFAKHVRRVTINEP